MTERETDALEDTDTADGRVVVVLCTYNESENLPKLVEAVQAAAPSVDLLVVDDGSPDGTGDLADELAAQHNGVHVIHRSGKLGLGSAQIAAMRWGLERGYGFVVTMDADFSHPPESLPMILDERDNVDVVVGSRYIAGGKIEGWPLKRHIMSRSINTYTRLLFRLPLHDCSGAFRCYSRPALESINFDDVISKGYSFQEEIVIRLHWAGCRFKEVPFTFRERREGTSKINIAEAITALKILFKLAVFGRRA